MATHRVIIESAGEAAARYGQGGDVNIPGLDQMPAEIRAGFSALQKEVANRVPPLNALFKSMGIEVSLKSMLKQSQIFTSYVGTIFQLFGAMIDVMLAPLLPYLVPAIRWMASKIPAIAATMQKLVQDIAEYLSPITEKMKDVFKGGWEEGWGNVGQWLNQKFTGWGLDSLGNGIENFFKWLGDNQGWGLVGLAIAAAITKKLVFKAPKILIGLAWGIGSYITSTADDAAEIIPQPGDEPRPRNLPDVPAVDVPGRPPTIASTLDEWNKSIQNIDGWIQRQSGLVVPPSLAMNEAAQATNIKLANERLSRLDAVKQYLDELSVPDWAKKAAKKSGTLLKVGGRFWDVFASVWGLGMIYNEWGPGIGPLGNAAQEREEEYAGRGLMPQDSHVQAYLNTVIGANEAITGIGADLALLNWMTKGLIPGLSTAALPGVGSAGLGFWAQAESMNYVEQMKRAEIERANPMEEMDWMQKAMFQAQPMLSYAEGPGTNMITDPSTWDLQYLLKTIFTPHVMDSGIPNRYDVPGFQTTNPYYGGAPEGTTAVWITITRDGLPYTYLGTRGDATRLADEGYQLEIEHIKSMTKE